ncbi:hypothetical protein CDAR_367881 [Caerostris darwini]|uniref:Secreted protein n=1 Tax=Caerostris darwini TaxID=1538125 RepID=A0AAV4R3P2_9ARAC|nr:hypothetical protein CDAR_367881 [Caerostris darwini]
MTKEVKCIIFCLLPNHLAFLASACTCCPVTFACMPAPRKHPSPPVAPVADVPDIVVCNFDWRCTSHLPEFCNSQGQFDALT